MKHANPNKLFPLVITENLAETRAFYTKTAGFEIVHDMEGYLQVRYGSEDGPELAFMAPDSAPPFGKLPVFPGQGLLISIPTPDADETHATLKTRGAKVVSEPSDKPWGWRSFVTTDPNGVLLDFFHVASESSVVDATG